MMGVTPLANTEHYSTRVTPCSDVPHVVDIWTPAIPLTPLDVGWPFCAGFSSILRTRHSKVNNSKVKRLSIHCH